MAALLGLDLPAVLEALGKQGVNTLEGVLRAGGSSEGAERLLHGRFMQQLLSKARAAFCAQTEHAEGFKHIEATLMPQLWVASGTHLYNNLCGTGYTMCHSAVLREAQEHASARFVAALIFELLGSDSLVESAFAAEQLREVLVRKPAAQDIIAAQPDWAARLVAALRSGARVIQRRAAGALRNKVLMAPENAAAAIAAGAMPALWEVLRGMPRQNAIATPVVVAALGALRALALAGREAAATAMADSGTSGQLAGCEPCLCMPCCRNRPRQGLS